MSAAKKKAEKSNVITGPWDGSGERAEGQPASWWVTLSPLQQRQASPEAEKVFKSLYPPRAFQRQPGKRRDHAPITFPTSGDGTYGYPCFTATRLKPWCLDFDPHASELSGLGKDVVALMLTHHEVLNITGRLVNTREPNPPDPEAHVDFAAAVQAPIQWFPGEEPAAPF